ncbi:antibiotic biosynthesis monooxygenase [Jiella sp. M17.18]|uniref:antibiotic biosynthesis monooxygenase family protein n=1 Tax=Jiella sp. M17.18 TaxID=3234247 RepID=UPI0034DF79C4
MAVITTEGGFVTQITTIETEPGRQDELVRILTERARFMAGQPGFQSISLHKSVDGRKIVNYVQWTSRELLEEAHRAPEFRERWPEVGERAQAAEPCLYEVVHTEDR